MNRNNLLEKHLLTRCYSSEARIQELLSSRYSLTGEQKPTLILLPTGSETDTKVHSLLHTEQKGGADDELRHRRKVNTRTELKEFIQTTLKNQKKVIKKIQAYNRETKARSKKPFPVEKLLHHYKIPMFEEFLLLNDLWQKYIQDLLLSGDNKKEFPPPSSVLPKLASADFNGCYMTVIHSRNQKVVGVEGIVVWDTQHAYILCVPRKDVNRETDSHEPVSPSQMVGGLRIIAKKHTIFAFDVIVPKKEKSDKSQDAEQGDYCVGFSIVGSRFEFRSVDRSGKKFKNHNVDNIL